MQLVTVDKTKCKPEKCENGVCIATFSCNWKVMEQGKPFELPVIDLARCTFTCPVGALQIINR